MALVETIDLGQKYGERNVLKNINLKYNKGDVFAMVGYTGAGKTTLLRLLDLLETPYSGKIYFDGMDMTYNKAHRLEIRRRISFVQQKPVVFNTSVFNNVAYGLKWRKVKDIIARSKAENALELVGMVDFKDKNAKTLSGGETQRIAIARALVTEPELLLLDEPTANLDPVSVSKIEEILTQVIREQKTTVVMTTHDMSQGQRLAGQVGVLINGEMLQVGSPNEIFTSPNSKEVAEFIGVENILTGVITQKNDSLVTIDINNRTIEAVSDCEPGDNVYALIRPEDIIITLTRDISSARNILSGRIVKMTSVGTLIRIEIDCNFPLLALITKKSSEELDLDIGKQVNANFKASAIRTIKKWVA